MRAGAGQGQGLQRGWEGAQITEGVGRGTDYRRGGKGQGLERGWEGAEITEGVEGADITEGVEKGRDCRGGGKGQMTVSLVKRGAELAKDQ